MIPTIVILILVAFASDMILTYYYLDAYKTRFPKKDWTLSESNLIIRTCVKNMGLAFGLTVGAAIVGTLLIILMKFLPTNWLYFILGIYFMTNAFHFLNFQALKRLNDKEVVEVK